MNIQNKKAVNGLAYVNANTNTYSPYGNDLTSGLNTSINTSSSTLLNDSNSSDEWEDWDESQNGDSGQGWFGSLWGNLKDKRSNLTEEDKQARRETGLDALKTGLDIWSMFKEEDEGESTYNPSYPQQNNNVMGLPTGLVVGIGALAVVGIAVLIIKKSGSKG